MRFNLITEANAKIMKSLAFGFRTMGIHLAPATLSGYNTCSSASKGCASACLNTAGRSAFSTVQLSRINKTKFFFKERETFFKDLALQLERRIKSAERKELKTCFRPNLTSDLPYENIRAKSLDNQTIIERFPDLQFYDYTKHANRMSAYLAGELPSNYHLTFSRNESLKNQKLCRSFLKAGGNCAYVFRDRLPATYEGYQVIDGDESDLRFLDKRGVIVGLVEKGKAKKDESGFVITDHLS